MGYDVEKHGEYDRNIAYWNYYGRNCERIGKKYQWIALYTLAAEVADNYKLKVHINDSGKTEREYCMGSFEPYIRNIDPTISLFESKQDESIKRPIHDKIYNIPNQDNHTWLANFDDFPLVENLLMQTYMGQDYLLLNGWYRWDEEKPLGIKKYQHSRKDCWILINSYIVEKNHLLPYIKKLSSADFMGRWAAEPNDNYQLFNKEYYWSEGYNFFQNPYYCGEEWVDFARDNNEFKDLSKVLLPTNIYTSERSGDNFNDSSITYYKPCHEIFDSLNLMYGKENSALYDINGDIVCFDSKELLQEDIGFFINFNSFKDYLAEKGYTFFWTILAEKRIIHDFFDKNLVNSLMPQLSGLAYYDTDDNIVFKENHFYE